MSNNQSHDEKNRYVATEIMGLCWHEWGEPKGSGFKIKLCCSCCGKSNWRSHIANNPDYCSDESPRSLLQGVVVKVSPTSRKAFYEAIRHPPPYSLALTLNSMSRPDLVNYTVGQTAEQIVDACIAAHRAAKGE